MPAKRETDSMDDVASLRLEIELTEREHSRDPHTNRFDIEVDGRQVRYKGPWGEGTRGRHETETARFRLTDDQLRWLGREFENYDLLQSAVETHEVDTSGDSCREIDADATIEYEGETYDLQVTGVTTIRGQDTDMEYAEQARGLKGLCWHFKGWAEQSGAWWNPFSRRGWSLFRLWPFT